MHRISGWRPSGSTAIAFVALFVALVGGAVALPGTNTVDSGDIKNDTIKSIDIKNKTIQVKDISVAARNALKGQKGATGATGATGAAATSVFPAWSASTYQTINNVTTGGPVAHLTFISPTAGFVVVNASFAARVRNRFDSTVADCRVSAQIAGAPGAPAVIDPGGTTAPGYIDQWVNGNLPTEAGGGTYLGLNMSGTRILPVAAGTNTVYLNGRHSCFEVFWGPITLTATLVESNPTSTITAN